MIFSDEGALIATINVSDAAVTDLLDFRSSDSTHQLAIATADGAVTVWSTTSTSKNFKRQHQLQPPGPSTANCVAIMPGNRILVAGFTCGHVKVYSLERMEIFANIAAHARPVSTLSASKTRPLLVSGGEDSVVNIWNIAEDDITLSFSEKLEHTLVVGSSFFGEGDSSIALSAFDYDGIFVWPLPNS